MNKNSVKHYKKTAITLTCVFVVWFILDKITKIYFDSGQFFLGQNISDSIFGIFHLTLVHNTGAAFGIFGDSTIILAILSLVIAVFLLAMPFVNIYLYNLGTNRFQANFMQLFCVAIVAAGGIGNAIDRFISGYVVDFICFDFIDFPVFNIADIGVTCGIILLLIIMIFKGMRNAD